MKTNLENVSSLNRKLSIELPAETVKNAYDRAYREVQRDVTIKGFRKGKAPISTVKSMYHAEITQDVIRNLIGTHFYLALKEHNVNPLGTPDFEYEDPSELSGFAFTATFDVRPEVILKKYEGLEVEREKFQTDESQVNAAIENIRNARATLKDVTEIRSAIMGDTAVIDFEGTLENQEPLQGGTAEDFQIELGSKRFIEGFEEGIVGMKVGDQKILNLKFPDPYHAADLTGKPVEFKVTLKGLKEKEMPEMNEEFFATWGGPKSMDDLKESIRKDRDESERKRIEDDFRNKLIKELVKNNPMEVPNSLKIDQKARLVEDFKKRMKDQQMDDAFLQDYLVKWDTEFNETAEDMIKASFLVDAIASKHELYCSDSDLNQRFADYALKTGIEESKIRDFYSTPEKADNLEYMITEEKVVKFLTDLAKIKEVPPKKARAEASL